MRIWLSIAAGLLTAAAAEPKPGFLPRGYLHTQGSQIVAQDGSPVRIAAIGWNGGDGGRYVPEGLYAVNYRQTMDAMKALGINAIRLPFTFAALAQVWALPVRRALTCQWHSKVGHGGYQEP